MEPIKLCENQENCELSPVDCGFYNSDTEGCDKPLDTPSENQLPGSTIEQTGDNSDANAANTSNESIEDNNTDGANPDSIGSANTEPTPDAGENEPTGTVTTPDEGIVSGDKVDPSKDPRYFYDGIIGDYRLKDEDKEYHPDGSITYKDANDN